MEENELNNILEGIQEKVLKQIEDFERNIENCEIKINQNNEEIKRINAENEELRNQAIKYKYSNESGRIEKSANNKKLLKNLLENNTTKIVNNDLAIDKIERENKEIQEEVQKINEKKNIFIKEKIKEIETVNKDIDNRYNEFVTNHNKENDKKINANNSKIERLNRKIDTINEKILLMNQVGNNKNTSSQEELRYKINEINETINELELENKDIENKAKRKFNNATKNYKRFKIKIGEIDKQIKSKVKDEQEQDDEELANQMAEGRENAQKEREEKQIAEGIANEKAKERKEQEKYEKEAEDAKKQDEEELANQMAKGREEAQAKREEEQIAEGIANEKAKERKEQEKYEQEVKDEQEQDDEELAKQIAEGTENENSNNSQITINPKNSINSIINPTKKKEEKTLPIKKNDEKIRIVVDAKENATKLYTGKELKDSKNVKINLKEKKKMFKDGRIDEIINNLRIDDGLHINKWLDKLFNIKKAEFDKPWSKFKLWNFKRKLDPSICYLLRYKPQLLSEYIEMFYYNENSQKNDKMSIEYDLTQADENTVAKISKYAKYAKSLINAKVEGEILSNNIFSRIIRKVKNIFNKNNNSENYANVENEKDEKKNVLKKYSEDINQEELNKTVAKLMSGEDKDKDDWNERCLGAINNKGKGIDR